MVTKIGVIADTHFPTRVPALPYEAIQKAFEGVQHIVHLGDIETQTTLEWLNTIAPVTAVYGDDDQQDKLPSLPLKTILSVEGVKIGVCHGHRSLWVERIRPFFRRLFGLPVDQWNGAEEDLLRLFSAEQVDMILFGHWHYVYNAFYKGVYLFNPGAVYAMTIDSIEWQMSAPQTWLRRRMLQAQWMLAQRHPERYHPIPSVGVLTLENGQLIKAEVIPLPIVAHPIHT